MKYAVFWGIAHRDVQDVEAIGIDEIAWRRGDKYLTLVHRIDVGCKRLSWIGRERTEDSLHGFFRLFSDEVRRGIRFPAMIQSLPIDSLPSSRLAYPTVQLPGSTSGHSDFSRKILATV